MTITLTILGILAGFALGVVVGCILGYLRGVDAGFRFIKKESGLRRRDRDGKTEWFLTGQRDE